MIAAVDMATWVASGAAVLAALTTTVLAIVAVRQMRGSTRQTEAVLEQAQATTELAQAAGPEALDRQLAAAIAKVDQMLAAAGVPFAQTAERITGSLEATARSLAQVAPNNVETPGDEPFPGVPGALESPHR